MRKLIILLVTIVSVLNLCACKDNNGNDENVVRMSLGEVAASDFLEFTLEESELAYFVSNERLTYVMPTEEENNLFSAGEGHCYVSLVFTISNKSYNRSVCYASSFAEWNPNWVVSYKGKDYPVKGFDLSSDEGTDFINLSYASIVKKQTGEAIAKNASVNYLLRPDETVTIRTFGVVDFEPDSLKDGYDFRVGVLRVDGQYEEFVYTVPAK